MQGNYQAHGRGTGNSHSSCYTKKDGQISTLAEIRAATQFVDHFRIKDSIGTQHHCILQKSMSIIDGERSLTFQPSEVS